MGSISRPLGNVFFDTCGTTGRVVVGRPDEPDVGGWGGEKLTCSASASPALAIALGYVGDSDLQ